MAAPAWHGGGPCADRRGSVIAELDLSEASVLVVGATGGLGSRMSTQLAARGARLTMVGRTREHVEALDVPGTTLTLDLRLAANIERAVEVAVEGSGRLDAVVNAVGVVAFGPVSDLSRATAEQLFLLNAFMPMLLAKAALRHLGDGGVIVNISGVVAERPMPGMAAYSASKAALMAFDSGLAREAKRSGVRVVDARPPHTETGLADHPIAGSAPRLPTGLDPDAVAERIVRAMADGETDLPSEAF